MWFSEKKKSYSYRLFSKARGKGYITNKSKKNVLPPDELPHERLFLST